MRKSLRAMVLLCVALFGSQARAAIPPGSAPAAWAESADPPEVMAVLDGAAVRAVGRLGLFLVSPPTSEGVRIRGYVQTLLTKRGHHLVILEAPEMVDDFAHISEACRRHSLGAVVFVRYSTTADIIEARAEVLDPLGLPLSTRGTSTPGWWAEDPLSGPGPAVTTAFSFRFRREHADVRPQVVDTDSPVGSRRARLEAPSIEDEPEPLVDDPEARARRKTARVSLRVTGAVTMGVGAIWLAAYGLGTAFIGGLCAGATILTLGTNSCGDSGLSSTGPLLISAAGTAVFVASFIAFRERPLVDRRSTDGSTRAPRAGLSSLSLSVTPLGGDGGAMILGGRF